MRLFHHRKWQKEYTWLVILFGLALLLRLWGIGFGLPYEYHVDEVQYVRQAAQMGTSGLEPAWWNNPPFFKYILLAEDGMLYVVGRLAGWYTSTSDFGNRLSLDPTLLYLFGRATSAFFGALTVLVTYAVGKVGFNSKTGWVAAILVTFAFLPVRESHFAVNDAPLTFWITLAVLASLLILKQAKIKWALLAGIALGLGFSTKYSGLAAVFPIGLAYLMLLKTHSWKTTLRLALFTGLAALVSAIVASPYFVITPQRVWHDVYQALYLAGQQGFDQWQLDPDGGYLFYLKTLVWGLGWPLLILSLLGVLNAIKRHSSVYILLAAFILLDYLFMGRQKMYFARFILPVLPALLTLAAAGLFQILDLIPRRLPSWSGVLLGFLIVLPSLVSDLRLGYLLNQTDTRTIAKSWIEKYIPSGSKIALDWPYHCPSLASPDHPLPGAPVQYDVYVAQENGLATQTLAWYQAQGFNYLVTCSHLSQIPLADSANQAKRSLFYQELDQNATLVNTVVPGEAYRLDDFIFDEIYAPAVILWQRQRPGPVIKVYQLEK